MLASSCMDLFVLLLEILRFLNVDTRVHAPKIRLTASFFRRVEPDDDALVRGGNGLVGPFIDCGGPERRKSNGENNQIGIF